MFTGPQLAYCYSEAGTPVRQNWMPLLKWTNSLVLSLAEIL